MVENDFEDVFSARFASTTSSSRSSPALCARVTRQLQGAETRQVVQLTGVFSGSKTSPTSDAIAVAGARPSDRSPASAPRLQRLLRHQPSRSSGRAACNRVPRRSSADPRRTGRPAACRPSSTRGHRTATNFASADSRSDRPASCRPTSADRS